MKKSESIGLVIPAGGCQAPGFHILIEILIKLASVYSKTLIIREAALSVEGEESALNFVNCQGCALIIFQPACSSSKKIASLIGMIKTPMVVIGRPVNNATSIWSDHFNAAYQATDLLLRYGHQQILLVGELNDYAGRKMIQGYRSALKEHNMTYYSSLELNMGRNITESRLQLGKFISQENNVSALLFTDISHYYGALSTLELTITGKCSPSLICFTQQNEQSLEYINVSTMNIPIKCMYEQVMTVAVRILQGDISFENICIQGTMSIKSDLSFQINNEHKLTSSPQNEPVQ